MIPLGILASSVRRASDALLAPTNLVATLVEPPPPLPTVIGEPYGGGFYAGDIQYPDGQWYKLIVADKSADIYGLQWGGYASSVASTDSDGLVNTELMVSSPTDYPAAQYCSNFDVGGNSDWYMPARNELNVLYLNLGPHQPSCPANFKSGGPQAFVDGQNYWSSTQQSIYRAWEQNLANGSPDYNNKDYENRRVRPIRRIAFTPD